MQRDGLACLPDLPRLGIGPTHFPRSARLAGSAQFQQVFKHAQLRSADAALTVLAVNNRLSTPRLGFAISRKSAHRAVARNRIKRVIRESFRNHRQQLPALDIVIISRAGIAKKTNKELCHSLEKHWKHLSQQCKKY